jgi:hypothetical protein
MTVTGTITRKKLFLLLAAILSILLCGAQAQDGNDKSNIETRTPPDMAAVHKHADVPISVPEAKLHDDAFITGAEDVLAINVWKEPEISRSVPVRSDGKISLPLVGEVQASGETPRKLEQEIASKLRSYVSEPEVTVIVQEIRSQRFNILGQVAKPGSYSLTNSVTVLDAIALAGGFRDFASAWRYELLGLAYDCAAALVFATILAGSAFSCFRG